MKRWLLLLPWALAIAGCAGPRGRAPSVADPRFLAAYAATRGFSLGAPRSFRWTPDGKSILFLRSGPRSFVSDLFEFDIETAAEKLLLSAEQILAGAEEELSPEEKARRERMRVAGRGITSYALARDGTKILVPLSGRLFVIERESARITELHSDAGFPLDPKLSPDGERVACVRDGDLYVIELATGTETRLTRRAADHITHGAAEFVAQEEMGRYSGFWWSPDSQRIAYQQTDESAVETLFIADPMSPDLPPSAWRYPRPGTPNASVRLGIIAASGGPTTWVDWDNVRFPYLTRVRWREKAPLTIVVQNRRQTLLHVLAVDPETGETTLLLEEADEAWLNLDSQMPRWLPDGRHFLWTSERGGAWQLELRARDGALVRSLTAPDLGYRSLLSVDVLGREAIVAASADPTQTHLFRIDLTADSSPALLTERPGHHSAVYSPDHTARVESFSSLAGRSPRLVRAVDGADIGEIDSRAQVPPFLPEVELIRVGENPQFHAAIVRPRNFDPRRRYPVIEYAYAGPSGGVVTSSAYSYLLNQWMADHGFIVVRIDGRGTTLRGRRWARAIHGNFIDAPLADHVSVLKALGRRYRELDLKRVGIHGWSFGGYFSAMAAIRHPEIYRAAVAGAPVVDWADYDTHYTERYIGLPSENPEAYRKSSVLTYADRLRRPLLLIHGTTDDNVHFTHSLKLSDALFRAGIAHNLVPLSNFTHMVADPEVAGRRDELTIDFFLRHLTDD